MLEKASISGGGGEQRLDRYNCPLVVNKAVWFFQKYSEIRRFTKVNAVFDAGSWSTNDA